MVLTGAAIARTDKMAVASGLISNVNLRNPLVVASYAATAVMLSNNRYALGVGRGADAIAQISGSPPITKQLLEDYVDILRRLWRGEVVNYNGPAGKLQNATLGMKLDVPPPIFMGAVGFKNCEWAGKFADAVLLNTFWTKEATEEGVRIVRRSAEQAGRDPARIKVWAILAAACEVPEELELNYIIRRLNTYLFFPRQWDATCKINNWDPKVADRLREELARIDGKPRAGTMGDENTSRNLDDIRRMRELWPQEWVNGSSAVGSAAHCAQCVQDRFDAGADGVVFHASAPAYLESLLKEWAKRRQVGKFDGMSPTPGL